MAEFSLWATRLRVPLHFLLATVLVWLARPTPPLLAAGGALVVLGLLMRAWAAGHLRRDQPLTVSGPYAHARHPLYVGSALILAGFAAASAVPLLGLMVAAYFLIFFVPVMRREERERRRAAEPQYAVYAARVPAFFPRLRPSRELEGSARRFDAAVFRRNREWRAWPGCLVLLALLYARMLW